MSSRHHSEKISLSALQKQVRLKIKHLVLFWKIDSFYIFENNTVNNFENYVTVHSYIFKIIAVFGHLDTFSKIIKK